MALPADLTAAGWMTGSDASGGNTTIGVVVTNARLDAIGCHLTAQSAHHGLALRVEQSGARHDTDMNAVRHSSGVSRSRRGRHRTRRSMMVGPASSARSIRPIMLGAPPRAQ